MTSTTTTFSTEVEFADLQDDFVQLTTKIGWCAVATIDQRDRPRTRILHVSWEIDDSRPIGWVSTSRSPIKTAHLARNPHVSCGYWSSAHDAVFADCRASWVEDGESKRHVWDLIAAEAVKRSFDPYSVWTSGADDPTFEVLRFDAWRVQVTRQDLVHGKTIGSSRVWHAPAVRINQRSGVAPTRS
jgi:general stress protein 26